MLKQLPNSTHTKKAIQCPTQLLAGIMTDLQFSYTLLRFLYLPLSRLLAEKKTYWGHQTFSDVSPRTKFELSKYIFLYFVLFISFYVSITIQSIKNWSASKKFLLTAFCSSRRYESTTHPCIIRVASAINARKQGDAHGKSAAKYFL